MTRSRWSRCSPSIARPSSSCWRKTWLARSVWRLPSRPLRNPSRRTPPMAMPTSHGCTTCWRCMRRSVWATLPPRSFATARRSLVPRCGRCSRTRASCGTCCGGVAGAWDSSLRLCWLCCCQPLAPAFTCSRRKIWQRVSPGARAVRWPLPSAPQCCSIPMRS